MFFKFQIVRSSSDPKRFNVVAINWAEEVGQVMKENVTFNQAQDYRDFYEEQQRKES